MCDMRIPLPIAGFEDGGRGHKPRNVDILSVQFSSVQLLRHVRLCNSMDCSMPGLPSPTPQLVQTHVHQVGGAIQPSHPLSSPFPPTFNLSQHQGLFQ